MLAVLIIWIFFHLHVPTIIILPSYVSLTSRHIQSCIGWSSHSELILCSADVIARIAHLCLRNLQCISSLIDTVGKRTSNLILSGKRRVTIGREITIAVREASLTLCQVIWQSGILGTQHLNDAASPSVTVVWGGSTIGWGGAPWGCSVWERRSVIDWIGWWGWDTVVRYTLHYGTRKRLVTIGMIFSPLGVSSEWGRGNEKREVAHECGLRWEGHRQLHMRWMILLDIDKLLDHPMILMESRELL